MKRKSTFLPILILATLPFLLSAQHNNLLNSRQSSELTYIYKITDKEAKKIAKKGVTDKDTTLLHELVTTYPTDSIFTEKLPTGHYIKTCSRQNKLEIAYAYVPEFDVFTVNNNTDMRIQVYNLQGKLISGAVVKIGSKRLKFDKQTQCYLLRKSNRKGVLTVSHQGNTAYYNLNREINYSSFQKGAIGLFYYSPLQYVWRPIDFIIRIPADGINSLRRGWAQGTIRTIGNFFENIFSASDNEDKYDGYLQFNKPKYLPGDTVKFKAFVVNKKGKPLNKEVAVTLKHPKKNIRLTTLTPYRAGGYEYQFFLHDSLNLILDKSYSISLHDKKKNVHYNSDYILSSFQYEDYELNHTTLTLNVSDNNQYKGRKFSVYAKGTDDNNLNLMDGRLEVTAFFKKAEQYIDSRVYLPDTLWHKEIILKPSGETEINVPDTDFPNANFTYTLHVKLLTSDNKTIVESKNIHYFSESRKVDLSLSNDSVRIDFLQNGESISKEVSVYASDNFANRTEIGKQKTPFSVPLNVYYKSYSATADSITGTLNIASKPSLIRSYSNRTADSLFIDIDNPRSLNFTYNIYKRNNEKERGYDNSLSVKKHTGNNQNYYLALQYLWGGKIVNESFKIPFQDKKLNIQVIQPRLVYPGQKGNVEITVTNQQGKPVENVDLTAYAFTKKFDYSPPTLPYLGKPMPEKKLVNNFKVKPPTSTKSVRLNYPAWKALADLDSIAYYNFIYPESNLYRYEHKTKEGITQFAPFVFKDGESQPVFVVYVDGLPVYFDWTTTKQPYSFRIQPGKHNVELRLRDRTVKLSGITFKKGVKTILSLPYDKQTDSIKWRKSKIHLSDYEKVSLNKYIFPYRDTFMGNTAIIENNGNIFHLNNNRHRHKYTGNFAGPIVGKVNFELLDEYEQQFDHEPYFEYDFAYQLLKMREVSSKRLPTNNALFSLKHISRSHDYLYQKGFSSLPQQPTLLDTVLTRSAIREEKQKMLELKRQAQIRYVFPTVTQKNNGTLIIEKAFSDRKSTRVPLNTLLLKDDDEHFIRIYPGNTNMFHDLNEGYYKLITFYNGSYYQTDDSLRVRPNGSNYYRIQVPVELKKDSFSIKVNSLIESSINNNAFNVNAYVKGYELKQIQTLYHSENAYKGDGDIISGVITDKYGEPIIGATILVKGTTYGTMTDLVGRYTINVPKGKYLLAVSYIGYEPYTINTREVFSYNAALTENTNMLEEMVVIGYGVQKKMSLTASVSSVTVEDALVGRVAGISVSAMSESPGKFMVRGTSSTDSSQQPLYIIDGKIFTGDISQLDVQDIQNFEVIKDASATAIYGANAANGVIIISTKNNAFKEVLAREDKGAEYDEEFLLSASQANSIRNNFSDYAFWQPRLTTDKRGKAIFEVTFPDDVTNWQTYILAMNDKRQSGQASGSIKSFKPLMAQLSTPSFLIRNDKINVIGKSLNYLPDSVQINTNFELDGKEIAGSQLYLKNSRIDSTTIIASSDSLKLRYMLQKEDGYFDGEERIIPVFPIGIEQAEGNFHILENDTIIHPVFDTSMGKVTLYADADYIDVLSYEVMRLINYRYECNEQLASKLIGLLSDRQISIYQNKEKNNNKNNRQIKSVINQIVKNKNKDGLWGWWKNSESNYPFSIHILSALEMAKKQGFSNDLNNDQMVKSISYVLEQNRFANPSRTIHLLKLIHGLDSTYNAVEYINQLDSTKKLSLTDQLHLTELKQLNKIEHDISALESMKDTTLFGNIYFADTAAHKSIFNSDIKNTLTAYKIIRYNNPQDPILSKIRLYLFETKLNHCWWNTYEAGMVLETILPDILKPGRKWEKSSLQISGSVNKEVDTFPFELKMKAEDVITIQKTGNDPIYLTTYQHIWNEKPEIKKSDFDINTSFENNNLTLKQGKETKLTVKLEVKKDADYVIINIPIPAGCSYASKKQFFRNEIHREYFKHETVIFCQKLSKGSYTFEINLMPRFSGNFTLNPAKAELMYFPTFNGNNEIKKVEIE